MPEVRTCATGCEARVRQNAIPCAWRGLRPDLQPSVAGARIKEVEHARAALLVDERVGAHGERSAAVCGARGSAASLKVESACGQRCRPVYCEHAVAFPQPLLESDAAVAAAAEAAAAATAQEALGHRAPAQAAACAQATRDVFVRTARGVAAQCGRQGGNGSLGLPPVLWCHGGAINTLRWPQC